MGKQVPQNDPASLKAARDIHRLNSAKATGRGNEHLAMQEDRDARALDEMLRKGAQDIKDALKG